MDFRVPELGEGIYEAELGDWRVAPGEAVKRGQTLMEVVTDKAIMEVPSPFVGTISELKAQSGDQIKIGEVVLTYTPAGQTEPNGQTPAETAAEQAAEARQQAAKEPRPAAATATAPPPAPSEVKAAPSVRRMARAMGIDLSQIPGSGPGGRILIDDLATVAQPSGDGKEKPRARRPRFDYGTPGTRVKFHGVRRMIAEHMVRSKRTVPHYSYVDECDVTDLVRLRESLKESAGRQGVRLTYLAFFVKAAVAALKEVPIVNSSLDEEAGEIVFHDRYDIGIATATPQGLVAPVVREVDRKDVLRIARDIERLSAEATAGKVRRDDLQGSTFTITSIGGIGGLISTPVINHPEVAILGIGRIVKRPVYDAAGNIRPAELVYLSFSFDHRVVDGAVGAVFSNTLIRHLQSPAPLLLPQG